MNSTYNTLLLDLIWRYYPEELRCLHSFSESEITILDYGTCSDNSFLSNYHGVKIDDNGVSKYGNVKFFESFRELECWQRENIEASHSIILAICCDNDVSNFSYSHFSVVSYVIPEKMTNIYSQIKYSKIYCANSLISLNSINREVLFTRLFMERMEQKEILLSKMYKQLGNNINELLFWSIFDSVLISTSNRSAMNELFNVIKGSAIMSSLSSQYHYEALLLGASGLLDYSQEADEYLWELRRTYNKLELSFSIKTMKPNSWKFSSSSPRQNLWLILVHLSAVFFKHKDLLFKIVETETLDQIVEIFNAPLSPYWCEHNYFTKLSTRIGKTNEFPKTKRNTLLINSIVPFKFFYNRQNPFANSEGLFDILMDILIETTPENHIHTRAWTSYDVENPNAFVSQALTQLSKCYCNEKLCPKCLIGIPQLLKSFK